jgi:hypothetical protein
MGLFDWLAQDIAGNPSATATYAGSQAVKPTFSVNEQGIGTQVSPYVPATSATTGPMGGAVKPTSTSLGKGTSGITYADIMKTLMQPGGKQPSGFLPQSPELGMVGGNVNPSAMQQGQGVFQQLNQPRGGSGNMLLGLLGSYLTGVPMR